MQVSIIIPAFNEAESLVQTLRHLQALDPPAWEIIVVDGGSTDDTVHLAQAIGATVLVAAQKGRAPQMNHGVVNATGEIVGFLHADTLLPIDAVAIMERTLADPAIACGGFISLMAGPLTTRWSISLHNYLKTYYAPLLFRPYLFFAKGLRVLFGDQVIFCRRQDFWACGGFDATLPIMEDADFCRRICQHGKVVQVNRVVQSSDRRVAKWGALKATAIYVYVGLLWGIGVSAEYLKQFYDDIR